MVLGKNRLSVDVCSQHLDLTNDETLFYFKILLQVRISKEEEFPPPLQQVQEWHQQDVLTLLGHLNISVL